MKFCTIRNNKEILNVGDVITELYEFQVSVPKTKYTDFAPLANYSRVYQNYL